MKKKNTFIYSRRIVTASEKCSKNNTIEQEKERESPYAG